MQFLGIWYNILEISLFYCESELVWEKGRVSCWIDSIVWVILKPPASWHWLCFKWHNVQLLPQFWHTQWLSSNHTCYLPFIHHFCSDSLLVQKINLKAHLWLWYFLFLDSIQIYIIARFHHFLFFEQYQKPNVLWIVASFGLRTDDTYINFLFKQSPLFWLKN